MTLVHLGGHFAGAQILHWSDGAQGKGALLTGDILQVGIDNSSVSVMRSYPNFIPLSSGHVERIRNRVEKLEFDRLYGAFSGREIQTDAKNLPLRPQKFRMQLLQVHACLTNPTKASTSNRAYNLLFRKPSCVHHLLFRKPTNLPPCRSKWRYETVHRCEFSF